MHTDFFLIFLGFALGSMLTIGGIGSASLVLALREPMENLLSGIALKVQDRFRVGEHVSQLSTSEEGDECSI